MAGARQGDADREAGAPAKEAAGEEAAGDERMSEFETYFIARKAGRNFIISSRAENALVAHIIIAPSTGEYYLQTSTEIYLNHTSLRLLSDFILEKNNKQKDKMLGKSAQGTKE
jgi:hypothetical protein